MISDRKKLMHVLNLEKKAYIENKKDYIKKFCQEMKR